MKNQLKTKVHCFRRCFLHNSSFSMLILSFSSFSQFWGSGATPNQCLWCFGGLRTSQRWFGMTKIDFEKSQKISKKLPQLHPKVSPCQHLFWRFWWGDDVFRCSFKFQECTMSQFFKFQHGLNRTQKLLIKILHSRRNFYICP